LEHEKFDSNLSNKDKSKSDINDKDDKFEITDLKMETEKLINLADLMTVFLSINKFTVESFVNWFSGKSEK